MFYTVLPDGHERAINAHAHLITALLPSMLGARSARLEAPSK
jgi:hypothetical protein